MPALNDAAAVYVGATPAQAVYLGDVKVWPPGGPPEFVASASDNPSPTVNGSAP